MDFLKSLLSPIKIPKFKKWSNTAIPSLLSPVTLFGLSSQPKSHHKRTTKNKHLNHISTVSSLVEKLPPANPSPKLYVNRKYDYKRENCGLHAMKVDRSLKRGLILNISDKMGNKKSQSEFSKTEKMSHEKFTPCKQKEQTSRIFDNTYLSKLDNRKPTEFKRDAPKIPPKIVAPPRRRKKLELNQTSSIKILPPTRPKPIIVGLLKKSKGSLDLSDIDQVENKSELYRILERSKKTNQISSTEFQSNENFSQIINQPKLLCRQRNSVDIFVPNQNAFDDFDEIFRPIETEVNFNSRKLVKLNEKITYINSDLSVGSSLSLDDNQNHKCAIIDTITEPSSNIKNNKFILRNEIYQSSLSNDNNSSINCNNNPNNQRCENCDMKIIDENLLKIMNKEEITVQIQQIDTNNSNNKHKLELPMETATNTKNCVLINNNFGESNDWDAEDGNNTPSTINDDYNYFKNRQNNFKRGFVFEGRLKKISRQGVTV